MLAMDDSKGKGFQPSGTRFWNASNNSIIEKCLWLVVKLIMNTKSLGINRDKVLSNPSLKEEIELTPYNLALFVLFTHFLLIHYLCVRVCVCEIYEI